MKGHGAVGTEILLTQSVQSYLFPLARDECLRLDMGNKPKQHHPIKYASLSVTLMLVAFEGEVFPFKKNVHHLAAQSSKKLN